MGKKPRISGEFWTKHAVERATRYRDLTEDDFREIVRLVCDRAGGLAMKKNGNGTAFMVQYKGQRIVLVIDLHERLIITFLPPDYFNAGALVARKVWRAATDRKIPDDFSQRRDKTRARPLEME